MNRILHILFLLSLGLLCFTVIYNKKKEDAIYVLSVLKEESYLESQDEEFKITLYFSYKDSMFVLKEENEYFIYDEHNKIKMNANRILLIDSQEYLGNIFYRYDYYFSIRQLHGPISFISAHFLIRNSNSSLETKIGSFCYLRNDYNFTTDCNLLKVVFDPNQIENRIDYFLISQDSMKIYEVENGYIKEEYVYLNALVETKVSIYFENTGLLKENGFFILKSLDEILYLPMVYFYNNYALSDIMPYLRLGNVYDTI